jgi:hypothetical protein
MSTIARLLFQLQEVELALEANEQAQARILSQLGENPEVTKARARLAAEQKNLDDLNKQQKTLEWEIDDLTIKIKNIEKKLYDGRIHDSKELGFLQKEGDDFKRNRSGIEDRALELMEKGDALRKTIDDIKNELARLEASWQDQQKQMTGELEQAKSDHVTLDIKRQAMLPQIDAAALDVYRDLRKRKGTAVAKVEQGICKGCRITLPNSDLQQAKGGGLVKCSSCGRILFLA